MNPLLLILLLGGGALYFSKLKDTGDKLSITVLNLSSFKIATGAIQVSVNVAIDNPTGTSLNLKQPNVKLFYKGNEVGNTIPNKKVTEIKANNRTTLPPIVMQIPFSDLPSVAMSLFTKSGTDKIAFDVEVSTEVNGLPITDRKTLSV